MMPDLSKTVASFAAAMVITAPGTALAQKATSAEPAPRSYDSRWQYDPNKAQHDAEGFELRIPLYKSSGEKNYDTPQLRLRQSSDDGSSITYTDQLAAMENWTTSSRNQNRYAPRFRSSDPDVSIGCSFKFGATRSGGCSLKIDGESIQDQWGDAKKALRLQPQRPF